MSRGPALNAAAVLLSCYGNVPPERAPQAIASCRRARSPPRCRLRSYPGTAAAHGTTALDAIRVAIEGKPWLPPLAAIN